MEKLRVTAHDGFPTIVEDNMLETYQEMNTRKDTDKRFVLEWVECDKDGNEVKGGKVKLAEGSATPKPNVTALQDENEKLKAELDALKNQKPVQHPAQNSKPGK